MNASALAGGLRACLISVRIQVMGPVIDNYASHLCLRDPLLSRGWQHDGRDAVNPENPGVLPQKIPS